MSDKVELVERVARAIYEAWDDDDEAALQNQARAAIAIVVEECAKVAQTTYTGTADDGLRIAIKIRALNPKEQ